MVLYGILILAASFVAVLLWRHDSPPAAGYVVFGGIVLALMLFLILDDEDRLRVLPVLRAGDTTYSVTYEIGLDRAHQLDECKRQLADARYDSGLRHLLGQSGSPSGQVR